LKAEGGVVPLSLTWTHPKAWKQLKAVEARVFAGAKQVATVKFTPAGAVSASGAVKVADHTIGHEGKTVSAALGLRFAKGLEGQVLSVDIAATDHNGHTQ